MRAAIYARFSSEQQQESSIDDQVRNAKRLIESKGWKLTQTYSDRGISGATTVRPGYQSMLADARGRLFDVIVAEGLDRLSRDQEATAALFKQLSFLGIAINTKADGEVSELHVGLKGTMNALFLKDLAVKTHRGLEGRVRKGKSAGGRAYGYSVVRTRDPEGNEVRGIRSINKAEALIVRRIFAEFLAGKSPRAIARDLNADAIPGPKGKAWRDTTIRGHATRRTGILRNDLYAGKLLWNKQTYLRNPETGMRVARVRDEREWIAAEIPELRIVEREVWEAVQQRLADIRASDGPTKIRRSEFWKKRRPKHLLTGLVYCGECGGRLAAVGKDYLACSAARSGARCRSSKSIRRDKLENVVLEGLKSRLLAPELVEEFVSAFNAEVNRQRLANEIRCHTDEADLQRVTRKLKGLYDAIADGLRTPGLKAELEELEKQQHKLAAAVALKAPPEPRLHPKLALVYREKVAELQTALNHPDVRTEAAGILRSLIERINVRFDGEGCLVELVGDIVKMVALPGTAVPPLFHSSVKVVAGVGFEPCNGRIGIATNLDVDRLGRRTRGTYVADRKGTLRTCLSPSSRFPLQALPRP